MSVFICPVCKEALARQENVYICPRRHSFDISSKGYVNLLLSKNTNSKLPGDNKMMVNARADFLSKGYYEHLSRMISDTVLEYFTGGTVLDAGCGEGYYTEGIYAALSEKGCDFKLCAIDISKFACAKAAKRFAGSSRCETAAASIFHMPLPDGSADITVNIFAPFCREEFCRVIKKGGFLIMAIPGENHLMSLKAAVYDEPYKNLPAAYNIDGFEFTNKKTLSKNIFIKSSRDLQSLFSMTPYYYKTSEEGHRRVNSLESLETPAEFEVLIYRKK